MLGGSICAGDRLASLAGCWLEADGIAMGEQGDNACVKCLAMECVGAEQLQ